MGPTIRTLIADDDSVARRRIRQTVEAQAAFRVVADCAASDPEFCSMLTWSLDVVFVDGGAPEFSALGAALASEPSRLVVAVSSRRERLPEAFDLGFVDFVLKPFTTERLVAACDRVRMRLRERAILEATNLAGELKRITVRLQDRLLFVNVADIDWIESANNYMVLHAGHDTHIVRETLSTLEQRLPTSQFLRVSRSALVNIARVREIRVDLDGGHQLLLAGGATIPLTRGIRDLQRRLELA